MNGLKQGSILGMAMAVRKSSGVVASLRSACPVNYGLYRQKGRNAFEQRYGKATFPGDWESQEDHAAFREAMRKAHPGWTLQGYANVSGSYE